MIFGKPNNVPDSQECWSINSSQLQIYEMHIFYERFRQRLDFNFIHLYYDKVAAKVSAGISKSLQIEQPLCNPDNIIYGMLGKIINLINDLLVAHHQDLKFLDIVDQEFLEARGQHVLGLLVTTITDVRHQHLPLEPPADPVINTSGLTPVFLLEI